MINYHYGFTMAAISAFSLQIEWKLIALNVVINAPVIMAIFTGYQFQYKLNCVCDMIQSFMLWICVF